MDSAVVGALVGVAACAAAAPYLARLTRTALAEHAWWRGAPVDRPCAAKTAAFAVALGALAGAAAGWHPVLPAFVLLALVATPLSVFDLEQHRLPNRLVVIAGFAGAVLLTVAATVGDDWSRLARSAEAAAVVAVLFVVLASVTRSLGMGDAKLASVLAGYLGWFSWGHVAYGVFAGFVLGAVVAFVLVATRRATLKSPIAFGPLLVIGELLVPALGLVPGAN